jgi:arylsulfatase A-like enzyme
MGWDHHAGLPAALRGQCRDTDQPTAALLDDLAARGLLDDTLVVWGGEFGRTIYSQGTLTETNYGRDHHPRCFTMLLAGAGIKPGITYGATDELGYAVVENPVTVHDLHATLLHLLGIDHLRLTFRAQGRDYRLTDIAGNVVQNLLA